jgi:hypothetical protein
MVIGTGLRAIKPFGSFQIKVLPYKLQGFSIKKNPRHYSTLVVIGTGLRAIKPFGSFQTLYGTIYLTH